MKKFVSCIFYVIVVLSLSACSDWLIDLNTPRTDELKAKYEFYSRSQHIICTSMNVTPEQADEVFLALVSIGMDSRVSSIHQKYKSDITYDVNWSGAYGYEVDLVGGEVNEIRHYSSVVYPYELSTEYLNQLEIDRVIALIDSLSIDSIRADYEDVQTAYEEMPKTLKKKIPDEQADKLSTVKDAIIQREQAIESVKYQIDRLNQYSSRESYEKAQAAYDDLSDILKSEIDSDYISKLNDAAESIRVREETAIEANSGSGDSIAHFNDYNTPEQQNTIEYVLNTSTKKVHEPSCSDVARIKPSNYSTIKILSDALIKGYQPCKRCDPS